MRSMSGVLRLCFEGAYLGPVFWLALSLSVRRLRLGSRLILGSWLSVSLCLWFTALDCRPWPLIVYFGLPLWALVSLGSQVCYFSWPEALSAFGSITDRHILCLRLWLAKLSWIFFSIGLALFSMLLACK